MAFIHEIRTDFDNRKHKVEKAQVVEYAGNRLADIDAEWLAAVERARTDKPYSWVAKLSRANSASGG